jgi:hypothetical protein
MQFNDTTNKSGLLQDCEFWCRFPDAGISGVTLLKQQFTRLINVRYARVLAKIQLLSGRDGAEDTNYTKQQFSYFNIVSGQNDYQFLTDADGNTISDITGVLILPSATDTEYKALDRLSLADNNAMLIMSPNASKVGTPCGFIEKNNTVFFDTLPNYSASNGGKLFYRLVPSYFTSSDTTKTPGYVEAYHRLLSIGASYDWLSVNKPGDIRLLARCETESKSMEDELETYIRQKNPTQIGMTARQHSSR